MCTDCEYDSIQFNQGRRYTNTEQQKQKKSSNSTRQSATTVLE